jgi:Zn-dependent protease
MVDVLNITQLTAPKLCARCATELPASALACPACSALVYRERLEELARSANAAAAGGNVESARAFWQEARDLLPPDTEQHRLIGARLSALPLEDETGRAAAAVKGQTSWKGRAIGVAVAVGLLLFGKLKFLLLGLSKLSTLVSMFGFIGVYWTLHGWPLAAGLAGSIYVHEMGHVAMLRKLGIRAGAPLFIPGVGALVMLKEHVTDPIVDARIGLAGPVWGLGAAVASWIVYFMTGAPIWLAITELTAFLNLFNLIPIWQLDGSRGFHALSRAERWIVIAVMAVALWVSGVRVLWILGAVAVYRAVRGETGPGHTPTLVTFAGLVVALAWLARSVG